LAEAGPRDGADWRMERRRGTGFSGPLARDLMIDHAAAGGHVGRLRLTDGRSDQGADLDRSALYRRHPGVDVHGQKSTGMTDEPARRHKPRGGEQRSGKDRRQADRGPPGKHERRRGLEPRMPEVVEREMSNSEWSALSQEPLAPTK